MSSLLKSYPERANDFNKRVHSNSRRARRDFRRATARALRATSNPLLEVGGPSEGGFLAVDGLRLSNGLIISNFEPTEGSSLIADVRNLPFHTHSLGGILMKGLTRVPEEIARAPLTPGEVQLGELIPHLMDDSGNVIRLILGAAQNDYSGWTDDKAMAYSQRLALLKEARRTIEPNGVFIASILSGGEIRLAESLGFELTASTVSEIDRHALHYNIGEFLMTLTDLNTPAGLIVEQLPASVT